MKKVTFYYVRHGRTEFNRDKIIQGGRVDSPLVSESVPTVERSARALSQIEFARCYVSPLNRTHQTAEVLLAGRDIEVKVNENLREFDFGDIDGKPYKGNKGTFTRCFLRQDFSSVGGESGKEVRERVRRAFKKMYKESADGDNILVVGHGARVPNAGIATIVATDGEFELVCMPVKAEKFRPVN